MGSMDRFVLNVEVNNLHHPVLNTDGYNWPVYSFNDSELITSHNLSETLKVLWLVSSDASTLD